MSSIRCGLLDFCSHAAILYHQPFHFVLQRAYLRHELASFVGRYRGSNDCSGYPTCSSQGPDLILALFDVLLRSTEMVVSSRFGGHINIGDVLVFAQQRQVEEDSYFCIRIPKEIKEIGNTRDFSYLGAGCPLQE